jgi:hypothetical protein
MNDKSFVLMFGTVDDPGYWLVGPFDSDDAALEWVDPDNSFENWWLISNPDPAKMGRLVSPGGETLTLPKEVVRGKSFVVVVRQPSGCPHDFWLVGPFDGGFEDDEPAQRWVDENGEGECHTWQGLENLDPDTAGRLMAPDEWPESMRECLA